MTDYSWIKPELKHLINGNPTDEEIYASLNNRISMFNGKLYKYFSITQNDENYALDDLKNNQIYYSNPLEFNDPFDCSLSLSLDDLEKPFINEIFKKNNKIPKAIIRQMVAKKLPELDKMAKENIVKIVGVSCFAECPDNILMWSHYADKHTGFCVEYDFSSIAPNDLCVFLYPVIYSQKRAFIPANMFDFSDITNITPRPTKLWLADWIQVLLTKSDIWKYELEWRSIAVLEHMSNRIIKQDIISKVYLGCKISEENEQLIRGIAKDKNIPVIKYEMDVDEYRLKE